MTSLSLFLPAAWPASVLIERFQANRRLPSIIIEICRGIISGPAALMRSRSLFLRIRSVREMTLHAIVELAIHLAGAEITRKRSSQCARASIRRPADLRARLMGSPTLRRAKGRRRRGVGDFEG